MNLTLMEKILGATAVVTFIALCMIVANGLLQKEHCSNCGEHTHILHHCKK